MTEPVTMPRTCTRCHSPESNGPGPCETSLPPRSYQRHDFETPACTCSAVDLEHRKGCPLRVDPSSVAESPSQPVHDSVGCVCTNWSAFNCCAQCAEKGCDKDKQGDPCRVTGRIATTETVPVATEPRSCPSLSFHPNHRCGEFCELFRSPFANDLQPAPAQPTAPEQRCGVNRVYRKWIGIDESEEVVITGTCNNTLPCSLHPATTEAEQSATIERLTEQLQDRLMQVAHLETQVETFQSERNEAVRQIAALESRVEDAERASVAAKRELANTRAANVGLHEVLAANDRKLDDYNECFSRPTIVATCALQDAEITLARAFDLTVDRLVNLECAQLRAKLEEVTRERDARPTDAYPTEWAYEQVCKANEAKRVEIANARLHLLTHLMSAEDEPPADASLPALAAQLSVRLAAAEARNAEYEVAADSMRRVRDIFDVPTNEDAISAIKAEEGRVDELSTALQFVKERAFPLVEILKNDQARLTVYTSGRCSFAEEILPTVNAALEGSKS